MPILLPQRASILSKSSTHVLLAALLLHHKIAPTSWASRAAFSAITSASACSVPGANQLAFTKAVIHTLAPADDTLPTSFTPTRLFNALPRVNQAYAQLTGDSQEVNAIISGNYIPQIYELGTTIPPLGTGSTRKIAPLDC